METIGIGLAGLGTVGGGVYKHLTGNRNLLRERVGLDLVVRRVVVRDLKRARTVNPPEEMLGTDWRALIDDPEVQIVVELMGGTEEARQLVLRAIEKGKTVITGNKALLAEHGPEIFGAAIARKVPVFYEAAAAGGIPIIKAVREAFIGNHIESMHGIINGTSNFILSRMHESPISFEEALAEAQENGYAEADPTLDINGWDAAHKAIILASLAYGFWVPAEKLYVEGIDQVRANDITFARSLGYTIKHLAVIKAGAGGVEVRVHPALIPSGHVLASVGGVFNAVAVRGDVVGDTLFYGRGAGQDPTASAVISDLAEAAIAIKAPRASYGFIPHDLYGDCQAVEDIVMQYYLRLSVVDKPGVLAQVAGVLGQHDVGISSVIQPESEEGEFAPLVLMIHDAPFGKVKQAIAAIAALECVGRPPHMIPVEALSS